MTIRIFGLNEGDLPLARWKAYQAWENQKRCAARGEAVEPRLDDFEYRYLLDEVG